MQPTEAVLTHNVVPFYAEPSGRSEQVSQGILGEKVTALDRHDGFVYVQSADDYRGWTRESHLRQDDIVASDSFDRQMLKAGCDEAYVSQAFGDVWEKPNGKRMATKFVWGTRLLRAPSNLKHESGRIGVLVPSGFFAPPLKCPLTLMWMLPESLSRWKPKARFDGDAACALGREFIGTPYLWGGGTPFGFDCSGYVQRIYSVLGITLPRDAYLQAQSSLGRFREAGKSVSAGDLVFFSGHDDSRERGITHVVMALNGRQFLHASGRSGVAVAEFDSPVIKGEYSYRGAWRYGPARANVHSKV